MQNINPWSNDWPFSHIFSEYSLKVGHKVFDRQLALTVENVQYNNDSQLRYSKNYLGDKGNDWECENKSWTTGGATDLIFIRAPSGTPVHNPDEIYYPGGHKEVE